MVGVADGSVVACIAGPTTGLVDGALNGALVGLDDMVDKTGTDVSVLLGAGRWLGRFVGAVVTSIAGATT